MSSKSFRLIQIVLINLLQRKIPNFDALLPRLYCIPKIILNALSLKCLPKRFLNRGSACLVNCFGFFAVKKRVQLLYELIYKLRQNPNFQLNPNKLFSRWFPILCFRQKGFPIWPCIICLCLFSLALPYTILSLSYTVRRSECCRFPFGRWLLFHHRVDRRISRSESIAVVDLP